MGTFEHIKDSRLQHIQSIDEQRAKELLNGHVRDPGEAIERLKSNPFGMIRVGEGECVRYNPKGNT